MLGFPDNGVIISVFAQGCAQMPPAAQPNACLFYVEVGMLAELNTVDGYFTVQAALAPASHVLIASCRLVGGFALVNWFDPSTHSGDFVFTVGGVRSDSLSRLIEFKSADSHSITERSSLRLTTP